MFKMEIIQIIQMIKTLFHYTIKKLFRYLSLKTNLIILLFLLFPLKFVSAQSVSVDEIYCDVSKVNLLEKGTNSISYKDSNFDLVISKINKDISNKKFNLLVSAGSKPSSGYNLEFKKIKIKKKKINLYFNEIKPPKNSKNLTVITYPFCLVQIDNLDKYKYKVKIKKKRSKFLIFKIF